MTTEATTYFISSKVRRLSLFFNKEDSDLSLNMEVIVTNNTLNVLQKMMVKV